MILVKLKYEKVMDLFRKQNTKKCFGVTHQGKVRQNNEDFIFLNEKENQYIVADGMGGHNAGEVASKEAVIFIENALKQGKVMSNSYNLEKVMKGIIYDTHEAVIEKAKTKSEYRGMGCTISLLLVEENNLLHTCHVGDSRIYLVNEGTIELIGTDHSVVAQAIKDGQMTEEEARESPIKNKLTMAIGANIELFPEYVSKQANPGDKVIICSDGLWDMISDKEIHNTCNTSDNAKEICNVLLEKALDAGGLDNISIITIIL